jgi:hypothetical protein
VTIATLPSNVITAVAGTTLTSVVDDADDDDDDVDDTFGVVDDDMAVGVGVGVGN